MKALLLDEPPEGGKKDPAGGGPPRYRITGNQLDQLSIALKTRDGSGLLGFLKNNLGKRILKKDLSDAITLYGHTRDKDTILMVLEDRWFHEYWSKESYLGKEADAHHNINGNYSIAGDLWEYLMTHHKVDLEPYKNH